MAYDFELVIMLLVGFAPPQLQNKCTFTLLIKSLCKIKSDSPALLVPEVLFSDRFLYLASALVSFRLLHWPVQSVM